MAWGENEIAMRETDAGSSNLQNGHVYELAFSGQRYNKIAAAPMQIVS